MRVGSELKDAFLEVSSNVETDCTKKSQVMYDDNSGSVAVGNGADAEYMITSQYKTINELRSAFYPTGTFLHSLLDQTSFRDFMGDTSAPTPADNKWREVSTLLTDVTDTNYVLIEESTTLGQFLITAGATQVTVGPTDYRRMANPKGRYLRGADPSISKDGISLASNTPLQQQNAQHTHSVSLPGNAGSIYSSGGDRQAASYFNAGGTTSAGASGPVGDESRPDTVVCNLYIKVNE